MAAETGVKQIRKRNGDIVEFNQDKITDAIYKAAVSVGGRDRRLAEKISDRVVEELEKKFDGHAVPTVEEIQDIVEKVLIDMGHARTAKSYILYRQKRAELRQAKATIGVVDDLKLSINALKVLEARYLKKDANRQVVETPKGMMRRVAHNIAEAEGNYGANEDALRKTEDEFYNMLISLEFLPNSPTLMNAGKELQQLSACFVLPVPDSMEGIFDAIKHAALVHQSGGGTGFSFSRLRPKGDIVRSTSGVASGPVSFMKVFNAATEVIKQGGTRRGANMGILRVDHPDILEFITSKEKNDQLTNFNISIGITERFMQAVLGNEDYELVNPHSGEAVNRLNARKVFDLIVMMAWKNGEPGIIFLDRLNKDNPTPALGQIESTNPCIAGDSLVSTSNGLELMEGLVGTGAEVCVDNRMVMLSIAGGCAVRGKGVSFSEALRVWESGMKKTMKLVTKSGFELVATPDHRIMTTGGWVKMAELKPSVHKVLIQGSAGAFSSDERIGINSEGAGSLNLPTKWSAELGQALGWLIGDGWLAEKDARVGFTFGDDDMEAFAHLKPFLNSIYGNEIKEVIRGNGVIHLSYHSKPFLEFFKSFGMDSPTSSESKRVPRRIFTAPKEAVVGFLQGLFSSDGTAGFVPDKSAYIRLTSKSRALLRDVQLLLLNFGIKARIYDRSRKPEMRFAYVSKAGEHREYLCDGIIYELEVSKDQVLVFLNEIGFIGSKNAGKIAKLQGKGYYTGRFEDEVASVEEGSEMAVYDLTEPLTHSFIANGIVISNCAEQPLLAYEACNLGSINLVKMVGEVEGKPAIDYPKLRRAVRSAVHFLDNVIDMSKFPLEQIEKMVRGNRKIGLGVMGFADMLIMLGVPYDSEDAVSLAEELMYFISTESRKMSEELAKKRGFFPNFKGSIYDKPGKGGMKVRNATTTTIAPTGTLSIIAGCSSGIEPLFAISYIRNVMDGTELLEVNPFFERVARERGFYSEYLMKLIAKRGTIGDVEEIPEDVRRLFVTAHDIKPEWHVRIQAAFQKYVDNAVSKTVNFPHDATPADVEQVYLLAHKLGCKGVTIYRDQSRENQVLNIETVKKAPVKEPENGKMPPSLASHNSYSPDFAGGCKTCSI